MEIAYNRLSDGAPYLTAVKAPASCALGVGDGTNLNDPSAVAGPAAYELAEALVQALPRLPTALQHTLQAVFLASAGPLAAAALGAAHNLVDQL